MYKTTPLKFAQTRERNKWMIILRKITQTFIGVKPDLQNFLRRTHFVWDETFVRHLIQRGWRFRWFLSRTCQPLWVKCLVECVKFRAHCMCVCETWLAHCSHRVWDAYIVWDLIRTECETFLLIVWDKCLVLCVRYARTLCKCLISHNVWDIWKSLTHCASTFACPNPPPFHGFCTPGRGCFKVQLTHIIV
jgi:hypothetical protein